MVDVTHQWGTPQREALRPGAPHEAAALGETQHGRTPQPGRAEGEREPHVPRDGAQASILLLQRAIGNGAVCALLGQPGPSLVSPPAGARPAIQRKRDCECGDGCSCGEAELSGLAGAADGPLEKEADQVAADLTGAPPADVPAAGDADEVIDVAAGDGDQAVVQRKAAGPDTRGPAAPAGGRATPADVLSQIRSARPAGHAAPATALSYFEDRFGADLSHVRMHADERADQLTRMLRARAFTSGADIFFRRGEYAPGSAAGQSLLAHELTHAIQQGEGRRPDAGPGHRPDSTIMRSPSAVQRQPAPSPAAQRPAAAADMIEFSVFVPADVTSIDQVFRLYELVAFGRETHEPWQCWDGTCDLAKRRGQTLRFRVHRAVVEANADPDAPARQEQEKKALAGKSAAAKKVILDEANKRYAQLSGDRTGTKITKADEGKSRTWNNQLDDVMSEGAKLEQLPPAIKTLLTGQAKEYSPKDYKQLLRIARKLGTLSPEDLAAFQLLTVRAADNIDLFEKSVDMFVARKAELVKALEAQQQAGQQAQQKPAPDQPPPAPDTLQGALDEKWKGLDERAVATMTESQRYDLARQMTAEMTEAQLKYMKDHPGETLADFAKSATLLNTPETFRGIGQDLAEAANGDANSWARWAAGTGAGAKVSGWLLALAGVLYVASWLTGVGELVTIAAAATVLLGSTLALSEAESELRIKAASQTKDPAEFKRDIQSAAAARANVIVSVAGIVIALALHFVAKAAFPKTMQNISRSLARLRERVRLRGSVYALKPSIAGEIGAYKAELTSVCDAAKVQSVAMSTEIAGLSADQFVDRLESGNGDFLDQTKLPVQQRVNYRELATFPEGRAAIELYRQRLIESLANDVPRQVDSLRQNYLGQLDEFLQDVDQAQTHEELEAAIDKLEPALTEERLKAFMRGQQDQLTKQKLAAAQGAMQQEALRLTQRSAAPQPPAPPATAPPAPAVTAPVPPPPVPAPAELAPAPSQPAPPEPAPPEPAPPEPAPPEAAPPAPATPARSGLDRARAQAEQNLGEERAKVSAKKSGMSEGEWSKSRAGATKRLYNLLERRAVLARMKVFPSRIFLEQAEVRGIESGGKITATSEISAAGKGRIADILELDGSSATLVDLKSASTQLKSVKGGMSSIDLEAEFRSASEIAQQHEVEQQVIAEAKRTGGRILVRGRDPLSGVPVEISLDPDSIRSRVTDYTDIGDN